MIDSTHVLTAAHLLYSAPDGGYATSIVAIPDANGSAAPFGVAYGTYERVDPSWLGLSQSHTGTTSPNVNDIGLVTLDQPIGNSTGWFKLGYTAVTVSMPAPRSNRPATRMLPRVGHKCT
jgi:V8-like Glu-specific endopeptidase